MRLVGKMVFAVVAAMIGVLGLYAPLSLDRYREQLREDMASDHRALSGALVEAIAVVWERGGREPAIALVDEVNLRKPEILIEVSDTLTDLAPTEVDQSILVRADDRALRTSMAVTVGGHPVGTLHTLESLAHEDAAVNARLWRLVLTAVAMIAAGAAVATILGRRLVGIPVARLAEQADRIGRGEVQTRVALRGRDELADLARVMNTMADRLTAARKTAEAEARARETALEQLRHADRLTTVGKLAAGIAHELGTPLNVVSLRAQQLARGETRAEEVVPLSSEIVDQARRIDRVIRQLLDFARVSKPRRTRVELLPLARRTIDMVLPIANRRSVEVSLSASAEEITAVADSDQLQQVLTNLLVNAIHASASGGHVDVSIDRQIALDPVARVERGTVAIAVRDDGAGITAEHLPRVFEPFFSTKEIGEGTGLGLSVAYGIVREHAGWIDVVTRLGSGSVFTVHLPDAPERPT